MSGVPRACDAKRRSEDVERQPEPRRSASAFMGRYRYRPLHLFGGLGLALGLVGFAVCLYLTILWLTGEAIGHRPLLTLGVLLVVVGMQFLSLGLIGELVTSHHEERAAEREQAELHVDEILS